MINSLKKEVLDGLGVGRTTEDVNSFFLDYSRRLDGRSGRLGALTGIRLVAAAAKSVVTAILLLSCLDCEVGVLLAQHVNNRIYLPMSSTFSDKPRSFRLQR